ncbi:hypothetical protein M434DRAFT_33805 [Hypoxylon sp. CO27-5]|nr:hypothetical protein M434DRAFT_33805 [Hypoxylon sp. CO27-5]
MTGLQLMGPSGQSISSIPVPTDARTAQWKMAKENDHSHIYSESNDQGRWPSECPPLLNDVNLRKSQSTTQVHLDTMPSSAFLSYSCTPSTLLTRFIMAMCRILGSRSFLSQDLLNLLTLPSVKEVLKRAFPNLPESVLDNYAIQISGILTFKNAPDYECSRQPSLRDERRLIPALMPVQNQRLVRIFAVLVLHNKVGSIPSFISKGFTNSLLPIDRAQFRDEIESSLPSSVALFKRCFDDWTMPDIKVFVETQWVVLSKGDISLFDFSAQTILPIFDSDTNYKPYVNVGECSIVRKVTIHLGHHGFGDNRGQPCFALKQPHSQRIKDFKREITALGPFAVSPHSHVVNLLAAFRHGASFYLLFPWAEGGNLRYFWKNNTKPTQDGSSLEWIPEQCLGIATALLRNHSGHYVAEEIETRRDVGPRRVSYHDLHGDIKPANILPSKKDPHSEISFSPNGDFSSEFYLGPCQGEVDYSDLMSTVPEILNMLIDNGQFYNNVTELSSTSVDGAGSMRNVVNNHQPDLSSVHCTRDTHDSPVLYRAPSAQNIPRSSNSRRRNLNDAISPHDMGQERKKKARTKEELLTHDALREESSETTSGQLSYATTKEALEPTAPTREERLFACPFHKRDPARYSTKAWKACIGPGWKISRLKEHIYRKHCVEGYRCDRCLSIFKDGSDLHRHSRSDPPCVKRDFDAEPDKIDESQKAQIQKKPRGISDEQKWNEIYRIIFKLDSAAEIPSPYCDTIIGRVDKLADKKIDGDSLADFEAYMKRQENDGNQQDVSAIRTCLDFVQRYRQSRTGVQSVTTPDMPNFMYDRSGDATRNSESEEFPSLTTTNGSISVTNAEDLNDLHYPDNPFGAHFNEVFSSDQAFGFPGSVGTDSGILPEGV